MQYSTVYDLNLPDVLARKVIDAIEAHMNNMCKRYERDSKAKPVIEDFVVAGVLHLPNVVLFESIQAEIVPQSVDSKFAELYPGYGHRSLPDFKRMEVKFKVVQEVLDSVNTQ
ncbi:hypothetical protein pEaSNUABM40_00166 [Erwinia phage pEa_SNUABM_40]|nr:hypothetical protein pEaSNUABM40_00166 [Erwinia phage pEa_SNUABM_40]